MAEKGNEEQRDVETDDSSGSISSSKKLVNAVKRQLQRNEPVNQKRLAKEYKDDFSRREFLKILGLGAGGVMAAGTVGQFMNGRKLPGSENKAPTGMATGSPDEIIQINYDQYSSPNEVYNVNDVRGSHQPQFTTERAKSGNKSLYYRFTNDQKIANSEYRFPEHGHGMPREIYTRFDLYPTNFALNANDTIRIFWAPLTNGSGSSGGGSTNGTNGWSNAIGFSHRNNSPAPDGYKFFSYCYHMDKSGSSGDFQMTDEPVMMDQWNTIEAYIKVNTYSGGSANRDGIMRYWVNGELAFERTDMRFTTTDSNLIEGVGPLGYVVGKQQGSMYYDNHVIAIGGMPEDRENISSGGQGTHEPVENTLTISGSGGNEVTYVLKADGKLERSGDDTPDEKDALFVTRAKGTLNGDQDSYTITNGGPTMFEADGPVEITYNDEELSGDEFQQLCDANRS